jgi:tetratricopeptide (TPR) repeat protein
MRNTLIMLLIFPVVCFAKQPDERLKKAEESYDGRRYKEAIAAYQQLVDEGYKSAGLYFNLGNSYYRNEEIGRAIYYYELSRKLEPDDEDVRINLGIASAKTIDKIETRENFLIQAVKTNVLSSMSTRTWAWLSILSVVLAAASFFAFVAAGSVAGKRTGFILCCAFAGCFLVTYLLGWSAAESKNDNKFAIVLAREVKVMNEPTASGTSKFTLHEGTKIRVLDINGDWLMLKLDNGNEGWVKAEDVGVI